MSKYGTLLTEAGRETKNMKRKLALFLTAALAIGTLAGCGKEKEPIKIASKPMTEQYVLTEILGQLPWKSQRESAAEPQISSRRF